MTETCHRGVRYSSAGNDQGYHRRRIDQGENQAPVKRRNITGDTLHAISNDRALQGKYQRNDGAGSPFVRGKQTYRQKAGLNNSTLVGKSRSNNSILVRSFLRCNKHTSAGSGHRPSGGQLHCLFISGHKHTGYSRIGQGHRRRIAFCNQFDTHA